MNSISKHEGKEEGTQLIVSGIPEELKMRFKLSCVRRGLSMSKVLIGAIRKFVEQNEVGR